MTTPLSPIDTAKALATLSQDGRNRLDELLNQKFILPEVEALTGLDAVRQCFNALGLASFNSQITKVADAKLRKTLETLGCPRRALTSLSSVEMRKLLVEFASGTRDAFVREPPARRARTGQTAPTKAAAPAPQDELPDVRTLYRESGTEAVYKAIKDLPVASLRRLVSEQNFPMPRNTRSRDQFTKQIQIVVREELGVRGDWIGAATRSSGGDKE